MAEKAIRSQGTVLYYNVGGSPSTYSALGKVMGLGGPNAQSAEIDQTDLDDTVYARKMAGIIDAGDFTFQLNLNPSDGGYAALKAAQEAKTLVEFKVTPPTGSLSCYFAGYVKNIGHSVPAREKYQASLAVMIDGGYSWA